MCKQKDHSYCTELGTEPDIWSRLSPLTKPDFVERGFQELRSLITFTTKADLNSAENALLPKSDNDLRIWFDVHAQNVGTWRYKEFKVAFPSPTLPLDPIKDFSKFRRTVFIRDGVRCRYCESPVVPSEVFRKLNKFVGDDHLTLTTTNSTSGHYLMFCSTLDHVFPHSLGGRTDENNLVTCCWSCNYGKSNYTLEQIGLDNPLHREPKIDQEWIALVESIWQSH